MLYKSFLVSLASLCVTAVTFAFDAVPDKARDTFACLSSIGMYASYCAMTKKRGQVESAVLLKPYGKDSTTLIYVKVIIVDGVKYSRSGKSMEQITSEATQNILGMSADVFVAWLFAHGVMLEEVSLHAAMNH